MNGNLSRRADHAQLEFQAGASDPNAAEPCWACNGRGGGEPDYFGNRDACDRCEGSGVEGGPDAVVD
jgi:DnaJ-class molecular chaperone